MLCITTVILVILVFIYQYLLSRLGIASSSRVQTSILLLSSSRFPSDQPILLLLEVRLGEVGERETTDE